MGVTTDEVAYEIHHTYQGVPVLNRPILLRKNPIAVYNP